jgi:DNA-3-methyladenine glycosylase
LISNNLNVKKFLNKDILSVLKIEQSFFIRDVLEVAPLLPGKKIVRIIEGIRKDFIITEVEAYRGVEDLACHASKGRTKRTGIMYHEGGHVYMYLIYGMYWMFNIVTGPSENPQAILIRSLEGVKGPGRVSLKLDLDGSFYGERIFDSERIWIEEGIKSPEIHSAGRIGVEYAGNYWSNVPWRFFIKI